MASIKDKLKNSSKVTSPVSSIAVVKTAEVVNSELYDLTTRIKNNVAQFERMKEKASILKQNIADDILFLAHNKDRLLPETNLIDYIENEIGISKGYYYQIKRSYEFLIENNQPKLINSVDFQILDKVARVKDEELQKDLLKNIETLTREELKEKCDRHTFSPAVKETANDKKPGSNWWTPEMEAEKKKKEKMISVITAKFQYNIDMYEDYIKQCRRAKKEKVENEVRISTYHVAISDLKELLKKILKDI